MWPQSAPSRLQQELLHHGCQWEKQGFGVLGRVFFFSYFLFKLREAFLIGWIHVMASILVDAASFLSINATVNLKLIVLLYCALCLSETGHSWEWGLVSHRPSFIKQTLTRIMGVRSFPRTDQHLSVWMWVQRTTKSHSILDLNSRKDFLLIWPTHGQMSRKWLLIKTGTVTFHSCFYAPFIRFLWGEGFTC